jgi:hypothetical protein
MKIRDKFLKYSIFLVITAGVVLFQRCADNENEVAPTLSVYVAGHILNAETQYGMAAYWKNGELVTLHDGPGDSDSFIYSMAFSGPDVYAAGTEYGVDAPSLAKYWKNGESVTLSDGETSAEAFSIVASEEDVYVAGYVTNAANGNHVVTYWKNDEPFSLHEAVHGEAKSITVSGSDVYIAGFLNYTKDVAVYWKNGIIQVLTNGSDNAQALGMAVTGTDVHVVGYQVVDNKRVAMYWKNGVGEPLTIGAYDAIANSIVVSGNDVYIAGSEKSTDGKAIATYWKNGIAVPLSSGVTDATANTIAVAGNTIYVTGANDLVSGNAAVLWKDGTAVSPFSGNASANKYNLWAVYVQ